MTGLSTRNAIVVGVDGSRTGLSAALWAAGVASRLHCRLVVACVATHPEYYFSNAAFLRSPEQPTQALQNAKVVVSGAIEFVRSNYADLDVVSTVLEGPVVAKLVALSEDARMVVLGNGGANVVSSLLLGSTALGVANHAHCPVVLWRGDHEPPESNHHRVVVGIDGSESGEEAIAHAFEYASAFGVPLVALHAWQPDTLPVHYPVADALHPVAVQAEAEAGLLAACIAGWAERYPDVVVIRATERGSAADALLAQAGSTDLLVVGSRGLHRVVGTLLGSTSQDMIHHAPCPVMICRIDD
ncbi:universal stress protein [Antrihabitans stalactiti]|uniref:Universal stress protein n=1 Tax=Antrihabitans stalactiti TaxID=2584121 RepID=A0A848KB65_9NOCA|nr:universal stress protein [Antrihabitans stalactiti]NMN93942.1 universal stress protein [Antrihabitans stalactiti]